MSLNVLGVVVHPAMGVGLGRPIGGDFSALRTFKPKYAFVELSVKKC